MFGRIAGTYDLLNDIMSLGLVRRWRQAAAARVADRAGMRVLDFGCGTGLMAARFKHATLVGIDISWPMLTRARLKLPGAGLVLASVGHLPFSAGVFDAAVGVFVLRNLCDLRGCLIEVVRTLTPRGRVVLLDLTAPQGRVFSRLFAVYFALVPLALGAAVGHPAAYRYLTQSLAQLPSSDDLVALLVATGLAEPSVTRLSGGMATLWTAVRVARPD
jgi:demethylmenaquinone methyltransferase/2-methoxy-6-polyprenyl-1,4-benzoquinol methylase